MQPWQPLLDWWFGAAGCGPGVTAGEVAASRRTLWFGKQDHQDDQARELFGGLVEQALAGQLQGWPAEPQGWLANLLLLDQLPRMIYRDTPRAFAGDALACPLALHGLALAWDPARVRLPGAGACRRSGAARSSRAAVSCPT